MTYVITRDAGTPRLTIKRFGHDALGGQCVDDLTAAMDAARRASLGMTGREVAIVSSGGVELYAYQDGVEVWRQGPWIKRAAR